MNSGHKSNSFSVIMGASNPISNEVNVKVSDVINSYQGMNSN